MFRLCWISIFVVPFLLSFCGVLLFLSADSSSFHQNSVSCIFVVLQLSSVLSIRHFPTWFHQLYLYSSCNLLLSSPSKHTSLKQSRSVRYFHTVSLYMQDISGYPIIIYTTAYVCRAFSILSQYFTLFICITGFSRLILLYLKFGYSFFIYLFNCFLFIIIIISTFIFLSIIIIII